MAKVTVDIDNIKKSLENIGYVVSDFEERNNNGAFWQIKFSNSGAVINIYDTNNKKNTVVNGKLESREKEFLKSMVDSIKCKELEIDEINSLIVQKINLRHEDENWDFKREWHEKKADLLHDILCLSNNTSNLEAYLIIGVTDDYEVVGTDAKYSSNMLFDFLRTKKFAGGNIPDIELKRVYYKYFPLDVVICKKSNKVPFYITEKYEGIFPNQIYTRVGDTNTPKTESASYKDIEKLWGIHFGVNR